MVDFEFSPAFSLVEIVDVGDVAVFDERCWIEMVDTCGKFHWSDVCGGPLRWLTMA